MSNLLLHARRCWHESSDLTNPEPVPLRSFRDRYDNGYESSAQFLELSVGLTSIVRDIREVFNAGASPDEDVVRLEVQHVPTHVCDVDERPFGLRLGAERDDVCYLEVRAPSEQLIPQRRKLPLVQAERSWRLLILERI